MSNSSGKRSRRPRGEPAAPLKVTSNYDQAAPSASEPAPDPFATLSHPQSCTAKAECQIRFAPWSGLDRWACAACGFETFEKSEAEARLRS
jgi:hypothetical protein